LRDSNDLAKGLYDVLSLNNDDYRKLSDNCRDIAMKLCSPDVQYERIEQIMKNSITN
jgi:hypothetical protein